MWHNFAPAGLPGFYGMEKERRGSFGVSGESCGVAHGATLGRVRAISRTFRQSAARIASLQGLHPPLGIVPPGLRHPEQFLGHEGGHLLLVGARLAGDGALDDVGEELAAEG